MEAFLMQIIENLRNHMVQTAVKKGSLVDETVVEISQQLDFYLYQFQLLKDRRRVHHLFCMMNFWPHKEKINAAV